MQNGNVTSSLENLAGNSCATDGQNMKYVAVYLISYHLPDGLLMWWHQSLSRDDAYEWANKLDEAGYRPQLHRADLRPHEAQQLPRHSMGVTWEQRQSLSRSVR